MWHFWLSTRISAEKYRVQRGTCSSHRCWSNNFCVYSVKSCMVIWFCDIHRLPLQVNDRLYVNKQTVNRTHNRIVTLIQIKYCKTPLPDKYAAVRFVVDRGTFLYGRLETQEQLLIFCKFFLFLVNDMGEMRYYNGIIKLLYQMKKRSRQGIRQFAKGVKEYK